MFNIKDFKKHREMILKHFTNKGFSVSKVSEFSTMTGIPLVVVYTMISDEFEEHRDICEEKIANINKFYGIFKRELH